MSPRRCSLVAFATLGALAGACGSSGPASNDATTGGRDGTGADAAVHVDDGTATRQTCTSNFGNGLTAAFGRLDGYLVAIVPPGNMNSCNDDDSHVHLQIRMSGAIYDIAIDATDDSSGVDDVHTATMEMDMPGGLPWSEGWHPGQIVDYLALGVHSTELPLDTKAQVVSTLQTDLATANHVSVYATGYGPDGAHLVHRNTGGHDGLLVTEPLSTPSHVRFFAFSDQTF